MTYPQQKPRGIIIFMLMNMIEKSSDEPQLYEAQAQLLKVLTRPARLAILNILREGEHCVCHMEAHLGFRQAYISQQLTVLREAGLIKDRRDGWNIFYRVAEPQIFEVLAAVEKITGPATIPSTQRPAVSCPCPKCSPA